MNKKHMEDTLVHEMIHAFDNCRFDVKWDDLRHHACSEVSVEFDVEYFHFEISTHTPNKLPFDFPLTLRSLLLTHLGIVADPSSQPLWRLSLDA